MKVEVAAFMLGRCSLPFMGGKSRGVKRDHWESCSPLRPNLCQAFAIKPHDSELHVQNTFLPKKLHFFFPAFIVAQLFPLSSRRIARMQASLPLSRVASRGSPCAWLITPLKGSVGSLIFRGTCSPPIFKDL